MLLIQLNFFFVIVDRIFVFFETRKPVIEDRVDIGTGACILGDVTVGHDSIVGANSVVVCDVLPHTTVSGIPARRIDL